MEYKISEGEQEWREEPIQVGLGKAVPDALPNPSSLSTISGSQRLEGKRTCKTYPAGQRAGTVDPGSQDGSTSKVKLHPSEIRDGFLRVVIHHLSLEG